MIKTSKKQEARRSYLGFAFRLKRHIFGSRLLIKTPTTWGRLLIKTPPNWGWIFDKNVKHVQGVGFLVKTPVTQVGF